MNTFIRTVSTRRKVGVAAATLATGAIIGIGVLGTTAQAETPSPTPSSTASPSTGGDRAMKPRGTKVTGAEATKVTDAVKAKDSAFTASRVIKRSDGSYLAFGTKSGERAAYKVSADLKTIEVAPTPPPGGKGEGRGKHTEVTGAEATKVTAAVKAKDASVTVTKVLKDDDGSYDVLGTQGSDRVRYEVSADLTTVEVHTHRR